jgi:hypothetical protein
MTLPLTRANMQYQELFATQLNAVAQSLISINVPAFAKRNLNFFQITKLFF